MTGSKNSLLALARLVPERVFGTMFIECFGVPVLKSYTMTEMKQLFGRYNVERCESRRPHEQLLVHRGEESLAHAFCRRASQGIRCER